MVAAGRRPIACRSGSTLIELLVTIVILAIGLLGMAELLSRVQVSEMESYQRAQALVLLDDMASRIATNRHAADSYATASALGAGMNCPSASSGETQQQIDAREWCNALQGAAEVVGGSRLGALLGGRGCVESLGNHEYLVTVVWQGLVPLSAPPPSVGCGQNLYNAATGSACVNDLCRRFVSTVVRIALLI